MSGNVVAVTPSPDSRIYALVAMGGGGDEESPGGGGPALYTISEDGSRLTRLSTAPAPDTGGGGPRGRGGFFGGGGMTPQWSRDGRTIYYAQGNGIYAVAAPAAPAGDSSAPAAFGGGFGGRGGRGWPGAGVAPAAAGSSTPRRVAFTVRFEVDQVAERRQVFEEAWRVMKNRFYEDRKSVV